MFIEVKSSVSTCVDQCRGIGTAAATMSVDALGARPQYGMRTPMLLSMQKTPKKITLGKF